MFHDIIDVMVIRILSILSLLLFSALHPSAAQADYFVWEDPDSGFTMSFPDTWKSVSGPNPESVYSIMAPSDREDPRCDVFIHDDKRYVIFPVDYAKDVHKDAISQKFWQSYLGRYQDYNIDNIVDDGGLGRWHASYALAGYTQYDGDIFETRQAIIFASLYYDKVYLIECSVLQDAFEDWLFPFMSVIKSVDFKKMHNELPTGHYRNFLKKAEKNFWFQAEGKAVEDY